jgi:hypothetical protein
MPAVPVAAVLSFLKDTRGLDGWTTQHLAKTLGIPGADATKVVMFMELQGYVKAASKAREWFTTPEGQAVSGSKLPHFTPERVQKGLDGLKERIAAARKDFKAPFKISAAVAFGDFLGKSARVQAADVGIELVRRKPKSDGKLSATESAERRDFLKNLRGKNAPLNVQPYEEWMGRRLHQELA